MRGVGGTAPPSVLPDISPTRGEIGSSGDGTLLATFVIGEISETANLPPSGGDVRQDRGGRRRAPTV
ncbi:precorrin-3B synthase/cobaltochelatase CobN [Mesorhizobium muleiense]|uniref:Precorrin-3B synthase/cobaltochelatase CobN n=1 Tax=Mesorhizobium muleiense TaxID=1004279 RepID=A0A1G9IY53_9HYPH|nr:precorrin-3B synthase/cobaltochelatase CobN [Mesorhizobium muleiense]